MRQQQGDLPLPQCGVWSRVLPGDRSLKPSQLNPEIDKLHAQLRAPFDGGEGDPMSVFPVDVVRAAKLLGLSVERQRKCTDERGVAYAGALRRSERLITVSEEYPDPVQRLTIAHEVGHWWLHPWLAGAHRDAIGQVLGGSSKIETEATQVGLRLLAPEWAVLRAFRLNFGRDCIASSEETLDLLSATVLGAGGRHRGPRSSGSLRRRCASLLAAAEVVSGVAVVSLARRFGLSTAATAIRLEETGIVR